MDKKSKCMQEPEDYLFRINMPYLLSLFYTVDSAMSTINNTTNPTRELFI